MVIRCLFPGREGRSKPVTVLSYKVDCPINLLFHFLAIEFHVKSSNVCVIFDSIVLVWLYWPLLFGFNESILNFAYHLPQNLKIISLYVKSFRKETYYDVWYLKLIWFFGGSYVSKRIEICQRGLNPFSDFCKLWITSKTDYLVLLSPFRIQAKIAKKCQCLLYMKKRWERYRQKLQNNLGKE